VRLGHDLLLAGELGLKLIAILLVVVELLLVLRKLSLEARFPLSLGFLVGVDLAGCEEVVEGDTGIRFDY
jgi:hypothetical protein